MRLSQRNVFPSIDFRFYFYHAACIHYLFYIKFSEMRSVNLLSWLLVSLGSISLCHPTGSAPLTSWGPKDIGFLPHVQESGPERRYAPSDEQLFQRVDHPSPLPAEFESTNSISKRTTEPPHSFVQQRAPGGRQLLLGKLAPPVAIRFQHPKDRLRAVAVSSTSTVVMILSKGTGQDGGAVVGIHLDLPAQNHPDPKSAYQVGESGMRQLLAECVKQGICPSVQSRSLAVRQAPLLRGVVVYPRDDNPADPMGPSQKQMIKAINEEFKKTTIHDVACLVQEKELPLMRIKIIDVKFVDLRSWPEVSSSVGVIDTEPSQWAEGEHPPS